MAFSGSTCRCTGVLHEEHPGAKQVPLGKVAGDTQAVALSDTCAVAALGAHTHPGGRCTTTAKVSGEPSTGAMGIVSTHRVKDPHRCTCEPDQQPSDKPTASCQFDESFGRP